MSLKFVLLVELLAKGHAGCMCMKALSRYWQMWCIGLGSGRWRYRRTELSPAQMFCQQAQFLDRLSIGSSAAGTLSISEHQTIQKALLLQFLGRHSDAPEALRQSAGAGLCLRCYVSEPIFKACQKIDRLFSGNKAFSYQDLLPFVLNDDGKSLVVIDSDKNQRVLDERDRPQPSTFKIFAVEVLKTYKANLGSKMSLNNWAFLRTKQHPELKDFLAEFGFKPYSDWTLINRIQVNQIERLSERDRCLVDAFHAVYRRDRRQNSQVGRCKDPNAQQLAEMSRQLTVRGVTFESDRDLLKALGQVAQQLRQFDIWQAREPLEVKDMETGGYRLRVDMPTEDTFDESEIEEQDFLSFLSQQLAVTLDAAIEQAIQTKLAKLQKSKKYAPFSASYCLGLRRYYKEGISLKEIGEQIGTSSWDQTRRILNPGELLSQVRLLTAQQILAPILQKAQAKGLTAAPAEPSYLKTLMEQIEAFVDAKLFSAAASEIKAGKNRSLDSEYAQALVKHLDRSARQVS